MAEAERVWRCRLEETTLWKDFKNNSVEGPKGKEQRCGKSLNIQRESLGGHEQKVGRDMSGEGHFNGVLDGNEESDIG